MFQKTLETLFKVLMTVIAILTFYFRLPLILNI